MSIPVSSTVSCFINLTRCVTITSGTQTWYLVGTSGNNITLINTTFYAARIGQTLGAAPTTNSGQLGYTTSTSLFFGSSFTGGNLPDNTGVLIPAPGVWLINYAVKLSTGNATGAINNFYTRISSPSAGYTTLSLGLSEISGAPQLNANTTVGITNNGSGILTVTNSTTYIYISVVLGIYAGPYTINNVSYLQFTRIA